MSQVLIVSFVFAAIGALIASFGFNVVQEGHVGIVFRLGKLSDAIYRPGLHLAIPLVDRFEQIQVTQQVDEVNQIACGTSGGVLISFDRVEVVNQLNETAVLDVVREFGIDYDQALVFQRLHSEINQHCSKATLRQVLIEKFDELDELLRDRLQHEANRFTKGLNIIAVRVTKPRLPRQIEQNFLNMEVQKAEVLVAQQRAKVQELEAETERKISQIHAQKETDISAIQNRRRIMEREALQNVSRIDDAILVARARAQAESESYRLELLAKANQDLLTPEYLQLRHIEAMGNTSKVFFGERLPSFYVDKSGGGRGQGAEDAAALHLAAPP